MPETPQTVGDLLAKAADVEPQSLKRVTTRDCVPVMKVLRAKGFTWVEVQKWLAEEGKSYSLSALETAYYLANKEGGGA